MTSDVQTDSRSRSLLRVTALAAAGVAALAATAVADTAEPLGFSRSAGIAAVALRAGSALAAQPGPAPRALIGPRPPNAAPDIAAEDPAPGATASRPGGDTRPGPCDAAAGRAAAATGVPLDLLLAIGRAESGRTAHGRFAPWPWTVNVAGAGRYFPDRDAAMAHARAALDGGTGNVDIGCFQINHRWHSRAFASLEEMFDPDTNARYAAEYLVRLRDETGSWERAAGAYHSRTPALRDRYAERVGQLRLRLPAETLALAAASEPAAAPEPTPASRSGRPVTVVAPALAVAAPRPGSILALRDREEPNHGGRIAIGGAPVRSGSASPGAIGLDHLFGRSGAEPAASPTGGRAS